MKFIRVTAFIAAWFSIPSLPGLAQTSTQFQACNRTAKTQLAMDMCASNELKLRQQQMTQVYNKLLSKAAKQPGAVTKIKAAEKAWDAFTAAYLEAMYPLADKQRWYGSVYPMEADLMLSELTQQHTGNLNALLVRYSPK